MKIEILLLLLTWLCMKDVAWGNIIRTQSLKNELLDKIGPRVKRISLRASDPLTRRSALEKNFIRFGRSSGTGVGSYIATDNRRAFPIRMRNNHSKEFTKNDRQRNFVRLGRQIRNPYENKEEYVEKSNNKYNFVGPDHEEPEGSNSNMYRSARRRDNFMRLGRTSDDSVDNYARKYDNFIRLGRTSDDFDSYTRKHDNFLRLGRSSDDHKRRDNYIRLGRSFDDYKRRDNYIRLGRSSKNSFNWNAKRRDSFMRFGRLSNDDFDRHIRRHDNFMRLGRPSDKFIESESKKINPELEIQLDDDSTRLHRRGNNFLRLGRDTLKPNSRFDGGDKIKMQDHDSQLDVSANTYNRDYRRHDSFMRLGRPFLTDYVKHCNESIENTPFNRYNRRQENFIRLGRIPYNRYRKHDSFTQKMENCADILNQNLQTLPQRDVDSLLDRFDRGHINYIILGKKLDQYLDDKLHSYRSKRQVSHVVDRSKQLNNSNKPVHRNKRSLADYDGELQIQEKKFFDQDGIKEADLIEIKRSDESTEIPIYHKQYRHDNFIRLGRRASQNYNAIPESRNNNDENYKIPKEGHTGTREYVLIDGTGNLDKIDEIKPNLQNVMKEIGDKYGKILLCTFLDEAARCKEENLYNWLRNSDPSKTYSLPYYVVTQSEKGETFLKSTTNLIFGNNEVQNLSNQNDDEQLFILYNKDNVPLDSTGNYLNVLQLKDKINAENKRQDENFDENVYIKRAKRSLKVDDKITTKSNSEVTSKQKNSNAHRSKQKCQGNNSFRSKILSNFEINPFSLKGLMSYLVPDIVDIMKTKRKQ